MKTKSIILTIVIGILAFAAVFGGIYLILDYHYNQEEIELRNLAEAQRGKVEANYDAMWKIISQEAQVADQYKEAFKEIYPAIMDGRYGNENGGTLVKFIRESNPEFDVSLYKNLQTSIEVNRKAFETTQNRMLDIIREHKDLCNGKFSGLFVDNKTPIEYTVVSSTKAKVAMETGIDDDVDLFKKDKDE